jgi:ABC-type transport system involved in multi-copper enzyme maturation permease subunit
MRRVAEMGKGKPFLEVLGSALSEEYRFPILEVFAVVFVVGTLLSYRDPLMYGGSLSPEAVAYSKVESLTIMTLFQLVIILKNIAYGLGNDLERGVIQTYLSYPLKRRLLLTAKLLSSVVIPILLLLGIQILALFILAPDVISTHCGLVVLTLAAMLGNPLLLIGLAFMLTLVLKKGRVALVGGIILYFAFLMATAWIGTMAYFADSDLIVRVLAVLMPFAAVSRYCRGGTLWTPSFAEASLYVGACYALVILVFVLGYIYFEKRLEA